MADILTTAIDKATASSHSLVTAVSGKRVRVYGIWIQAAGTVTVTFEDDDGTNLTGGIVLNAREKMEWFPLSDGTGNWLPYLVTQQGDGFNMLLSDAVQVSGTLWYGQED